jgi:hypothetical protein
MVGFEQFKHPTLFYNNESPLTIQKDNDDAGRLYRIRMIDANTSGSGLV